MKMNVVEALTLQTGEHVFRVKGTSELCLSGKHGAIFYVPEANQAEVIIRGGFAARNVLNKLTGSPDRSIRDRAIVLQIPSILIPRAIELLKPVLGKKRAKRSASYFAYLRRLKRDEDHPKSRQAERGKKKSKLLQNDHNEQELERV